MATTFLEPGSDATFNVAGGQFWATLNGTPTSVSDFVHGTHQRSTKFIGTQSMRTPTGILSDAGGRISIYFYFNVLPSSTSRILRVEQSGGTNSICALEVKSTGVLILTQGNSRVQIGSDGTTLSAGLWYRISLAYTVTDTATNRFEVFVNGSSSISVTNATISVVTSDKFNLGNIDSNGSLDFRTSDHYADNSSSLTDTGNIWVTAKRPNANGTTNGFITQIGTGGSGYGTGHSPQVNERPLSTANGWSIVATGAAITEEYNVEGVSTGDINLTGATIVDYVGWVHTKALVGETANIILGGANFAQAITSSIVLYTKVKGSNTYPAGTGTDVGLQTDTSSTTVSLYESGILVAFIPSNTTSGNFFAFM